MAATAAPSRSSTPGRSAVPGNSSVGIVAFTAGGNGAFGLGGLGHAGNGGGISITNVGTITMSGSGGQGISATSQSGSGPIDSTLATGGAIQITNSGAISTTSAALGGSHGIVAQSLGTGGSGGSNGDIITGDAGHGGAANHAGAISITNLGPISTFAGASHDIFATSQGGRGGNGGTGNGLNGSGGSGNSGGNASGVVISNTGTLTTAGAASNGIFGQSLGGAGGDGGSAGGIHASGGDGGAGGSSANVTVTNTGAITTASSAAYGILAKSWGGDGGSGGSATGLAATNGGSGGGGGIGGHVTVSLTNASSIVTSGEAAHAIYAVSQGGGGGGAGNAGAIFGQGGGAGAGGGAGNVIVTVDGTVTTSGLAAYGVLASSTGGGGGSGGSGSGVVGIGTGGGAASPGGIVTVANNGVIATTGDFSHAISASSIGGGGGTGGDSGGPVSIGGAGSASGSGDHVGVTNNGSITTAGAAAYGVFAQSVGGGGGNGGNSSGWISVGGSGGPGSNGGTVDVTNIGFIKTTGLYGFGIYAQSVGGGGGDGGYGNSYGVSTPVSVGIGGSGGDGGFGSAVNVINGGTIIVSGYRASAIFAQSIGGGGGNGGDAMAVGVSPIAFAIGGSGGKGGDGGTVTVTNDGLVATQSDRSVGIYAQSVGGGGGNGGSSFAVSANVVAIAVAVGGTGGDGGKGDLVAINQNGTIVTQGTDSYGIYAQSVGGGGGNGGSAAALAVSASPKQSAAVSVAVGGSGGTGGDAGLVNVSNAGTILTSGAGATGVIAQSIGGGGGNGGSADSTAVVFFAAKQNLALAVAVGGSGGTAGNGNAVTVTNNGRIVTVGDDAHGIHAQSIGGGGGTGGAGRATAMASSLDINLKDYADKVIAIVNAATRSDTLPQTPDMPVPDLPGKDDKDKADKTKTDKDKEKGGSQSVALSIGVGGHGGAAGNGNTVTVTNVGRIDTFGFMSYGIFAQSIGGGGGEGGGGSANADAGSTLNIGGGAGGGGGSAGNGGDVTVANTGIIATRGHDLSAIVAQSIGGGGGVGGAGDANAGLDTNSISVSVGGTGGSTADFGGHVTVSQTGDIITVGDRAMGVLAQSIGSGGGLGGTGSAGNAGTIFVGGGGGTGSNGGQVDVNVIGNITTFGMAAHGVLAQSVGGGGGIGGDVSGSLLTVGIGVGGAAGASGNGGTVNVTTTGNILTQGMRSFGILAQSIGGGGGLGGGGAGSLGTLSFAGSNGGAGFGGAININHVGSVVALGQDSHAVFAQSTGGSGGSDITIHLQQGLVSGGTGAAAGLYLDGGATNAITLASTAELTSLSGLAVKATGGAVTNTSNSGLVIGNVDLGTGSGSFGNMAGGTFVPNTIVNLGGGTLSNDGLLIPGGTRTAVTTALTGNFAQSTAGTLAVDVRFGQSPSDLMNVTGTANVRGLVAPTLLWLAPTAPVTIVNAAGGFTGTNDATPVNTPIISYGLQYIGNTLQISPQSVNFVPPGFAGNLNSNEGGVAGHFQNVWNSGIPSSLGGVMAYLANFTDGSAYAAALNQLTPQSILAQPTGVMLTGMGFLDGMMSCRSAEGPQAPLREHECVWARFTGGVANQQAGGGNMAYRETGERIQVGVQSRLAPDAFYGFGMSFETARTTTPGLATSDAQRGDVGFAVKKQMGNLLLAGALDFGVATVSTTRSISFPTPVSAASQAQIWHADARFRAAYLIEAGRAYFKPSIDFDVFHVEMPGFNETGAGVLNLNVNGLSQTIGSVTPALEIGTSYLFNDSTVLRPFAIGGFSAFSSNRWSVNSTFEGTPAGVNPFTTTATFPGLLYKVSAGMDFISTKKFGGLDVRFVYDGQLADKFQNHTGSIKAALRF